MTDTPTTARELMLGQHQRWVENSGVETPTQDVEVDLLLSYSGEVGSFFKRKLQNFDKFVKDTPQGKYLEFGTWQSAADMHKM